MKSESSLTNYLKEIFDLSKEDEHFANRYFEKKEIKKGDILLNSGEICTHLYFVSDGLLRTFHINKNGSEFTRLFVPERKFCTVLLSFQEKISSPATVQALENSTIYSISHTNFKKVIAESPTAKNIYTHILEEYQNFQITRLEFLTTLNPQEKVEQFLAENSALEKRISSKVIASYLQITPETYSRCKKKMTS